MPLDDSTATKPAIAREIMTDFPVLPRCNYIAGLSAGGAAAAIMGSTYPGSLRRNRRAFRIGVRGLIRSSVSFYGYAQRTAAGLQHRDRAQNVIPTIVFHGDRDRTVNLANGDQVIVQAKAAAYLRVKVIQGEAGGLHYTLVNLVGGIRI